MAATTKLIHVRPASRLITSPPPFYLFSSSTTIPDSNDKQPEPGSDSDSGSRSTSYFSDIKSTLKQTQQTNPRFPKPTKPFTFSPSTAPNSLNSPSKLPSLEEISKTLSGFRRRADPPPPPPPNQHISFQDILQRNTYSKTKDSSFNDGRSNVNLGLSSIKASLSRVKPANPSERFPKIQNSMSLSDFKASLNMRPTDPTADGSPMVIGGSDNLQKLVFGKELKDKKLEENDETTRSQFVKSYTVGELGEKLKMLRPVKSGDKKDWFSFGELNERLAKLRKMELEDRGASNNKEFAYMRGVLMNLKVQEEEKAQKEARQRIDILSHLGRTPSFMLGPPKEELVEKYFHPDNMSASEKLKLELQKVRDEFKMSESDCGSARVQVAQLTTKIHHLSSVLHKKDKHSRKGLQAMVQKRKSLLKYLRRTDWESYSFVLSKLGLRDNPDIKG